MPAICVCAGHLRRFVSVTTSSCVRLLHSSSQSTFHLTRSAASPPMKKGNWCCSMGQSCCISLSTMRAFATDPDARARAITWMFAALNTVEPPIVEWEGFMLLEKDKAWFQERLPLLENNIRNRLNRLSGYLGEKAWLDAQFSAADLLMVTVLRRLEPSNFPGTLNIVEEFSNLSNYVERGKNRPAYKRAFEAQLAVFTAAKG